MELKELLHKRGQIVHQAREINELADKEARMKTPEEGARFDSLCKEAETLSEEITRRHRIDTLAGIIATNGDRQSDPLPHQEPRNLGRYSVLRAILTLADRGKLDGIEGEVSAELIKRRAGVIGRSVPANGFVMPYDLPVDLRSAAIGRTRYGDPQYRAFDTTAGAGGIPLILDTTYIEILRNRMVTRQAGARVLTDMSGNFAIPRQSTTQAMYWLAEGTAPPSAGQPVVDQVPFTPRTAGAYTDITRRLAEQLNTDAEMFVREDLAAVVARGVDLAGLNGPGTGNAPLGIMQIPAVPSVPIGTNGGPPTWSTVVGLETSVAKLNADLGALAYMTNAVGRGTFKQTPKVAASTFPIFLWEDGEVNGYQCFVTNQLPGNLTKGTGTNLSPVLFGNWNDLIYAFWSGQDVIVDPYTGSSSGTIRIVTLQDCDVNVRHPESFAKCVDMVTM
jgi:HK97 family phage major capsid protein